MGDDIDDRVIVELPNIMQLSTRIIDGTRWVYMSIFDGEVSKDDWKYAKKILESHFLLIYEKKVMYHFVFDLHVIPMKRLPEFMKLLAKYQYVLNECLLSTAVITQNKFLYTAIQLALELYTPSRPLKFFYKEHTDTSPSEEYSTISINVLSQVKEYFRDQN
tara:strand:+ start:3977 stop:4462 length:486 start_codon:yes stop_codon:yes gene_type:complete